MTAKRMLDLIERLHPLRLAPNSSDTNKCVAMLAAEAPFEVFEYEAGREINGWVLPKQWEIEEAKIFDASGRLVYDGMHHPLAVIGYSRSFEGQVDGAELKQHLFYSDVIEDAIVYHCDLFYKPFRELWGFSVPKVLYDTIGDGKYRVVLRTRFDNGTMKAMRWRLEGDSPETFVMNAHNCHATLCNDDLSGIAVGMEVMRRLADRPRRRMSYELLIAPEHFGSIAFLEDLPRDQAARYKWGVFLESLGSTGELALQRSFVGDTLVDRAFLNVLRHSVKEWRTELFRKVIGNDETCWEAVGFEVPFASLSRMPFPEYHTSRDTPALMNAEKLEEAVRVVLGAIEVMERDNVMDAQFRGLVALSHPRHNLYRAFWDPSEPDRRTISDNDRSWNYLMDCLPRYFDGDTRLIEIAERHQLPFASVADYVDEFAAKGLVQLRSAPFIDPPVRQLPPR